MRGKTLMGSNEKLVMPLVVEALNKMFGSATLYPNGDVVISVACVECGRISREVDNELLGRIIDDKGLEYALEMWFNDISRQVSGMFSKSQFKGARNG